MVPLDDIVRLLSEFDGISRKFVLPRIIREMREKAFRGDVSHTLGEDSAVVPTACDEAVLLTTDAIMEGFCLRQPRAAGFNVVLANVMDIYAAGGVPTSIAVALAYSDERVAASLLEGLIDATHRFRVPLIRGHTTPNASTTYIVGSATGTVRKDDLLTAGGALPGDAIVLLFDPSGSRGTAYRLGWDCVTGGDSDTIIRRLSVMNDLAQQHILHAAKDVSVAGMIGTAGMLLEYSGCGGTIYLDEIDGVRPPGIPMEDWLRMFISLGFLVTLPQRAVERLRAVAETHGVTAATVGFADDSHTLRLRLGDEIATIFDFSAGAVLTPSGRDR